MASFTEDGTSSLETSRLIMSKSFVSIPLRTFKHHWLMNFFSSLVYTNVLHQHLYSIFTSCGTIVLAVKLQCLPKVLEHLLWFMLQTSYKIPSPLKQCCVKEIWITLYVELMHFCITKGFGYRLNIVWRGEGVCTPIGDTKKGKESENL